MFLKAFGQKIGKIYISMQMIRTRLSFFIIPKIKLFYYYNIPDYKTKCALFVNDWKVCTNPY